MKLTGFYMNIVSSTALVVRESWEQFAIAACWIGGITQTQVAALTTMMMWFLCVQQSTAANLVDIRLNTNINPHKHTDIFVSALKVWDYMLKRKLFDHNGD